MKIVLRPFAHGFIGMVRATLRGSVMLFYSADDSELLSSQYFCAYSSMLSWAPPDDLIDNDHTFSSETLTSKVCPLDPWFPGCCRVPTCSMSLVSWVLPRSHVSHVSHVVEMSFRRSSGRCVLDFLGVTWVVGFTRV